jgi:hypothetical protein
VLQASGTGISQVNTEALVCASAGRIEMTTDAVAAPSISARRRVGCGSLAWRSVASPSMVETPFTLARDWQADEMVTARGRRGHCR